MIVGMGHDLVDISRVRRVFERHDQRFLARVFTEEECAAATSLSAPYEFLAKRWAAKEACAKALGTGFRDGVAMRDIGVTRNAIGRPLLVLGGGALRRLETIMPKGLSAHCHLSLSDEPPVASAYVIIEGLPKDINV